MQQPDITAQREGKTVIVSKAVRLTAEDILAMELKDGETVTLELTIALDVDEPSQLIDNGPRSGRHFAFVPRADIYYALAANKSHRPGRPLSSCDPHSENFKPDPATRSVTTRETRTSLD
jgi:hypothetical protein